MEDSLLQGTTLTLDGARSKQAMSQYCVVGGCLLHLLLMAVPLRAIEEWTDFRGPEGNGCSATRGLPLVWSETEQVAWKADIPGYGWSSPVAWGERVWLTTATVDGRRLRAIAVDHASGRMLHDVTVFEVQQPETIDPTNSYASPSPVIESGRVYVHFGTYGTACLDAESGQVLWRRTDFPVDHQKGPGSSPVLCDGLLIFQCDGNDVQCMVALDKRDGSTVWKTARTIDLSSRDPDFRKSFSTPLVVHVDGQTQIISTAAGGVYAYESGSGQELWRVRYDGHTNVSRPVASESMVFINTGYPKAELWGVRLGGHGDVTATHVAWKVNRNVPIKPSLLLSDDLLYQVSDAGGIVTCLQSQTGQTVWQRRLGGNYAASPLLADDRVYLLSEEGVTTVIKPGREWQELAENHLSGVFCASAAVVGQSLLLRSRTHLYRIDP